MKTRIEVAAAMEQLNKTKHFAGIADEFERLLKIVGSVEGGDNTVALVIVAFENVVGEKLN